MDEIPESFSDREESLSFDFDQLGGSARASRSQSPRPSASPSPKKPVREKVNGHHTPEQPAPAVPRKRKMEDQKEEEKGEQAKEEAEEPSELWGAVQTPESKRPPTKDYPFADERDRQIVFPPPGFRPRDWGAVTVAQQDDTEGGRDYFFFVQEERAQREERELLRFEWPQGVQWRLALVEGGVWLEAEPDAREQAAGARWWRVLSFEIKVGNPGTAREHSVSGRDAIFNAAFMENGMEEAEARPMRLLARHGWLLIQLRLCGRGRRGISAQAIPETAKAKTLVASRAEQRAARGGFGGIRNEGATCYLNSLLQSYFLLGAFSRQVFDLPPARRERSIGGALQRLFFALAEGRTASARELLRSFGWGAAEVQQQHDAQEFSALLLEALEARAPRLGSLFRGRSVSRVECENVEEASERESPFEELQLPVRGVDSLQDALRQLVAPELLRGSNQYESEHHGKQDARRSTRFDTLPPVLRIQLLRFQYDPAAAGLSKLDSRFSFPLRFEPGKLLGCQAPPYSLHAVLLHRGSLAAGHYYAFLRPEPGPGGPWFRFDDERVFPVAEQAALAEAYGGSRPRLEFQSGRVVRRARPSNVSAYMLVYLAQPEAKRLLDRPSPQELPPALRLEARPRRLHNRLQDRSRLQAQVLLFTRETLLGWPAAGLAPYRSVFGLGSRQFQQPSRRLSLWLPSGLTHSQAAGLIVFRAGWDPNETAVRLWLVKTTSGEFLPPAANLYRCRLGDGCAFFVERLPDGKNGGKGGPLLERAEEARRQGVEARNQELKDYSRRFELDPLLQLEAPRWRLPRRTTDAQRALLLQESNPDEEDKKAAAQDSDGGGCSSESDPDEDDWGPARLEAEPRLFSVFTPSDFPSTPILVGLKVFDSSLDPPLRLQDLVSAKPDATVEELAAQLGLPEEAPILQEKLLSLSVVQVEHFQRTVEVKLSAQIESLVTNSAKPLVLLVGVAKHESEDPAQEVGHYLWHSLSSVEAELWEVGGTASRATLTLTKTQTFESVTDAVCEAVGATRVRLFEEGKGGALVEAEKGSVAQLLVHPIQEEQEEDKEKEKEQEEEEEGAPLLPRLYFRPTELKAGDWRVAAVRYDYRMRPSAEPTEVVLPRSSSAGQLQAILETDMLLLQRSHRLIEVVAPETLLSSFYPRLECSESAKAEVGLVLRAQTLLKGQKEASRSKRALGVVWYMRGGLGAFGEPALFFYSPRQPLRKLLKALDAACSNIRQVWPEGCQQAGARIKTHEHQLARLQFAGHYRTAKVTTFTPEQLDLPAEKVFPSSRRAGGGGELPQVGYVFENSMVEAAPAPLAILAESQDSQPVAPPPLH